MKFGIMLILFAFFATLYSGWRYFIIAKSQQKKVKKNGKPVNLNLARQSFYAMTIFISLATVFLLYLILNHQFQVSYIYRYSSKALPLGYLISTFWAGQEGSFLLWAFLSAIMGVVLIRTAGQFEAHAMLVINVVQGFFLAILLKASPFELLPQIPLDGAGLNPLLQNPWMVIHPPILFVGYAAIVFPFALAIAALVRREYGQFVTRALPWALFSSLMLGAGIIIGGYWAYKVLGWGGYWGWDPVENSSLVPWLTTLALIHGLLVQRKTGAMIKTNLLLAIFSFVLVIYATFLTRSGVLADFSVHSFQDLGINLYLIVFILSMLGIGLWMFAKRYREIPTVELNVSTLNRETILLASMIVLSISAFLTFVGTSSPILTGLVGKPAQVDISYYNIIHLPIGIALALFLGFAPFLRWNLTENLLKTLLPSIALALGSAAVAFWAGMSDGMMLAFTATAAFALWSNLFTTVKLFRINWKISGAPLSHVGVGLLLLGIVVSATFETTEQALLEQGVPQRVLGHELVYKGIVPVANGKNVVHINVTSNDDSYEALPRFYFSEYNNGAMREPDVRAGLLADFYISPLELRNSEPAENNATTLRIRKGETKAFRDMQVAFNAFDMGEHAGTENMRVGAKLTITVDAKTYSIAPAIVFEQNKKRAENGIFDLEVDGKKQAVTVILNGLDAGQKMIELAFEGLPKPASSAASTKEMLIVEVSNKPFMSILWIGTILIIIGAIIALINRRQTSVVTQKEPGNVAKLHKNCPKCHTRNDVSARFCYNCGGKLSGKVTVVEKMKI